jgi:repressor LexA
VRGVHIVDGDMVILKTQRCARRRHCCRVDRRRNDIETLGVVERGRPYLKAENPRYPDLVPARELKIQGVMVSLLRKQERRKKH